MGVLKIKEKPSGLKKMIKLKQKLENISTFVTE